MKLKTEILNAVIEDESLPKSSSKEINSFIFKTPLDLVFTKGEPERKFIEHLCKSENAKLHFENLNLELKTKKIKELCHFHFLSPSSYIVFFDHLKNGKLLEDKFTSELELLLLAEDE